MLIHIGKNLCESFYTWVKVTSDPDSKRYAEHLVSTKVHLSILTSKVQNNIRNIPGNWQKANFKLSIALSQMHWQSDTSNFTIL